MPFEIQKSDIFTFSGDAIINPTDAFLSGSGGLDKRNHKVGGWRFRLECAKVKALETGDTVMTRGGNLLCRYVIHTSAPFWTGDTLEEEQLRRCYRNSLALAERHGLKDLAFPLIGCVTKGFPEELVLRTAAEEISAFLATHEDTYILLIIYDRSEFQPDPTLLGDLENYIEAVNRQQERQNAIFHQASTDVFSAITAEDIRAEQRRQASRPEVRRPEFYPEASAPMPMGRPKLAKPSFHLPKRKTAAQKNDEKPLPAASSPFEDADTLEKPGCFALPSSFELEREMVLDESFSEMVVRKIDERRFKKDSECYTRANIDRRIFSRIRCDTQYRPKKTTALALAVALELSLEETNELLLKADYSLSHSIMSDVIVEYCIVRHIYNIFEINELLFQYDQALLGG